ncbi:MAG: hypothetical protein P1V21_27700 [Rhizobiaceae bacterium]|nr:hypothetical protein [Rhizobiaceae bacterium]
MTSSSADDAERLLPYLDLMESNGPKVGLFWFIDGTVLAASIALKDADVYGECLTYDGGHSDHWDSWQEAGAQWLAQHDLPTVICRTEYEEHPRGRVIYEKKQKAFIIYADRRLHKPAAVKALMERFGILEEAVLVRGDPHYR